MLVSYVKRATAGALAAFLIGLIVVGICNTIWALSQDFPIGQLWNWNSSPSQVFLASAPFLALAAAGVVAPRPWIVGLCLTLAFWGFYLFQITRPDEGGGANIGLGLLMMFSPVPILIGCVVAALTMRANSNETSVSGKG